MKALDKAVKYNWRTGLRDKKNLSDESKMEYIFKFGSLDEILSVTKQKPSLAEYIFKTRTNQDITMALKSKKLIRFIIKIVIDEKNQAMKNRKKSTN